MLSKVRAAPHARNRKVRREPAARAERAGFEPATHLSARTRFPVALLRPLGHLSVLRSGEGGIRTLDGGFFPHNALAGRRLQPLGHFSAAPRRIAEGLRGVLRRRGRLSTIATAPAATGPMSASPELPRLR